MYTYLHWEVEVVVLKLVMVVGTLSSSGKNLWEKLQVEIWALEMTEKKKEKLGK